MQTCIIIGGVAGGASAAARLRRLDEKARIIIIERGPYISFANCGLPYHLSGIIPRRDALLVTRDGTVQFIALESGRRIGSSNLAMEGVVSVLARHTPDPPFFAAGDSKGQVRLFRPDHRSASMAEPTTSKLLG